MKKSKSYGKHLNNLAKTSPPPSTEDPDGIFVQVLDWGVQQQLLSLTSRDKLIKELHKRKRIENKTKQLTKSTSTVSSHTPRGKSSSPREETGGKKQITKQPSKEVEKKILKSPRGKQPKTEDIKVMIDHDPKKDRSKIPRVVTVDTSDQDDTPPVVDKRGTTTLTSATPSTREKKRKKREIEYYTEFKCQRSIGGK